MKLFPECMPCMVEQVNKALRLLSPNISQDRIVDAQQELMKRIGNLDLQNTANVLVGSVTYRIVSEFLGIEDPYADIKKEYNQIALDFYPKVKMMVADSENPIAMAVRASIMGNSIDFGAPTDIDIDREIKELELNDLGGEDNIRNFIEHIENSHKILVLGDNAGEIVFDRIFIETLQEYYPDKKIIYSVRGGPIINDNTMNDAIFVGMDKVCKVVETSATPGVYLEDSTDEFVEAFKNADLILSKGQGNFEAVVDIPTEHVDVYFLLKAKCDLMTKIFDVPQGTLLLVKKEKDLVARIANGNYSTNCL